MKKLFNSLSGNFRQRLPLRFHLLNYSCIVSFLWDNLSNFQLANTINSTNIYSNYSIGYFSAVASYSGGFRTDTNPDSDFGTCTQKLHNRI
jgi:hypothetical protein